MAESNEGWGALAETDAELAEAWDSYERLPEPGENSVLDAFCDNKHLSIPALLRLGAKLADPDVLAFAYDRGIKFRNMIDGRMWSYLGSEWPHMKVVRASGEQTEQIIVCEGESDGARLVTGYEVDIAIMPGGATNYPESMSAQLEDYDQVLVGLDRDEAGEIGSSKIAQSHPNTIRFIPASDGDWCDQDDLPALPDMTEPQPDLSSQLLVNARDMLTMEVPDIPSWLDHDVLPIGGQLILHGWAKSMKSYMSFDLLTRLAQGQDWCCFEPMEEPCKVAIIQFEIPWAYYHARITMLRNNAPEAELFEQNVFTWTPMQRPELVAGNPQHEDKILRALLDAGIQLVLIDPIRRAIGSADLNAENEVRRMLRFFQRIQDLGITVIATHHDNKDGARAGGGSSVSMTGSGAFAGDCDTIISVELPRDVSEEEPKRNLNFLTRNSPAIGPRSVEMHEDGHLVYDTQPIIADEEVGDTTDAPQI